MSKPDSLGSHGIRVLNYTKRMETTNVDGFSGGRSATDGDPSVDRLIVVLVTRNGPLVGQVNLPATAVFTMTT
jgi:hypothetical protein